MKIVALELYSARFYETNLFAIFIQKRDSQCYVDIEHIEINYSRMNPVSDQDILAVKRRFEIIGNSEKLSHALRVALQVGPTEMSVLISGESGVGKESFSKIIHSLSRRKHGQFIAINCGAIPGGTIDSELFGHEKGAFTGGA